MFIKIVYAILLFICGVLVLKYRKFVYDQTGKFAWAEHYLGSGGTMIVIILSGLLLIFLSVAYPSGVFDMPQKGNNSNQIQIDK